MDIYNSGKHKGGIIFIPRGIYKITDTLNINENTSLLGEVNFSWFKSNINTFESGSIIDGSSFLDPEKVLMQAIPIVKSTGLLYNYGNPIAGSLVLSGTAMDSGNYTFKDNLSKKYFKIVRFNPYGDKFRQAQTYKIDNKELIVKVDPLQYNDKTFGTKENPILVFWYEGANEKLMTDIRTDEKDKDGFYINKDVQLSPTEEEYRYNVTQYLTYVMPKEEFKKRFEN